MKIYLHIGAHKTGTTSIQHAFRANEKLLADNKILYPGYEMLNAQGEHGHHSIAHSIAGKGRFNIDKVKLFIADVLSKADRYDFAIISAEPFCRHLIGSRRGGQFWQARDAYIRKVAQLFGSECEVVYIVRRQDDFAPSLYQEKVKKNRFSLCFDDYISSYQPDFDYKKNAQSWAKHFNKVTVQSFENLRARGDLVEEFLYFITGKRIQLAYVKLANESWSFDYIEFKRNLNSTVLSKDHLNKVSEQLIANPILNKEKFYWIDHSKRLAFVDKFKSANESLESMYLPAGEVLFPSLVKELDVYPGLSSDTFYSLLKQYLLELEDPADSGGVSGCKET